MLSMDHQTVIASETFFHLLSFIALCSLYHGGAPAETDALCSLKNGAFAPFFIVVFYEIHPVIQPGPGRVRFRRGRPVVIPYHCRRR